VSQWVAPSISICDKQAALELAEADAVAKQHEAELLASLEGEPAAASKEQSEKAKKKSRNQSLTGRWLCRSGRQRRSSSG
jgi:uncharacterized cupin superfamily protein